MKNPRFTDYHNYPYDYILERNHAKGLITNDDKEIITTYIIEKLSKGLIEDLRAQRVATSLCQWRRFIKVPYNELTYNELLKGIAASRKGNTVYGKPYAPNSIRQNIKVIKTFVRYLIKNKIVNINYVDLDEIKYPHEVLDSVKSSDLLSQEDVEKLIGSAMSIRDKAIIGIAADTGLRPVDIAGLKWRDLDYNQRRVKITVTTEKTNIVVNCYVILHKSWLVELRKQYNIAGADDYIFLDDRGLPLSYIAVDRMIKRASKKSGVKFPKGAWMKLFRATSITEKQRAGYSPSAISKTHFGVSDSKMMRHYSKYCDADTEREALEKSGVEPMPEHEILKPTMCTVCTEPLSPGVKFCPECGTPQTPEAKNKLQIQIEQAHLLPSYEKYEKLNDRVNELEKQLGLK
jgi:integrase